MIFRDFSLSTGVCVCVSVFECLWGNVRFMFESQKQEKTKSERCLERRFLAFSRDDIQSACGITHDVTEQPMNICVIRQPVTAQLSTVESVSNLLIAGLVKCLRKFEFLFVLFRLVGGISNRVA